MTAKLTGTGAPPTVSGFKGRVRFVPWIKRAQQRAGAYPAVLKSAGLNFLTVAVLLVASSASGQTASPYINPYARVENYSGGSCVFAGASTAANYLGAPQLARWIRTHRSGAESHWHLNRDLNRWGVETRFTENRDKAVLDFAHRRGLPAVIAYKRGHSCLFMGWIIDADGRITHARIWDSNYPDDYEYPTFRRFLSRWYGEAVVMVLKG